MNNHQATTNRPNHEHLPPFASFCNLGLYTQINGHCSDLLRPTYILTRLVLCDRLNRPHYEHCSSVYLFVCASRAGFWFESKNKYYQKQD